MQPSGETAVEQQSGGEAVTTGEAIEEAPHVPLPLGSREGSREQTQAGVGDEDGQRVVSDEEEDDDIAELMDYAHKTDQLVMVTCCLYQFIDTQPCG